MIAGIKLLVMNAEFIERQHCFKCLKQLFDYWLTLIWLFFILSLCSSHLSPVSQPSVLHTDCPPLSKP